MFHIDKEHLFLDQTEEKKEEGLKRGEWVDVSFGFLISGLGEPNIYHDLGEFTRIGGFYLETVWLVKN